MTASQRRALATAFERLQQRIEAQPEVTMDKFNCRNCGDYCPSGTLENGLCSQCDLIGKQITVLWGRFGTEICLAQKVSRNGILYASRWNKKRKEWTSPRPVESRRGYWILKE